MKTRRAFIQAGAAALCGLAAAPALATPRKIKEAGWTETFDVIVIGSGLAGRAGVHSSPPKGNGTLRALRDVPPHAHNPPHRPVHA